MRKWAGDDKAIPLHEFFETTENTARIANWSQEEIIRIALLKLRDSARSFCNVNLELHDEKSLGRHLRRLSKNDLEMC